MSRTPISADNSSEVAASVKHRVLKDESGTRGCIRSIIIASIAKAGMIFIIVLLAQIITEPGFELGVSINSDNVQTCEM